MLDGIEVWTRGRKKAQLDSEFPGQGSRALCRVRRSIVQKQDNAESAPRPPDVPQMRLKRVLIPVVSLVQNDFPRLNRLSPKQDPIGASPPELHLSLFTNLAPASAKRRLTGESRLVAE
jgi:hypothetical protein